MRNEEKLLFGCFEVTSYFCIGAAFYFNSFWFGAIGVGLFAVTAVWFVRLAKRVGVRLPWRR
jgi:hypothetical protein